MPSRNQEQVCCDDGSTLTPSSAVYTDWTAIALLLFTAVPLLIVVATATYFVIQNDQKTPLG